jgi:hypothetical protein
MKWIAVLLAGSCALGASSVIADESVSEPPSSVLIGQQFTLIVTVDAPANAEVEINTEAASWNTVEVVRIDELRSAELPTGEVRHTFTLTLAAFAPGAQEFAPEVFVIEQGQFGITPFDPLPLAVESTLAPGTLLQLSPVGEPQGVSGAQSPFLVPGVVAGSIAAILFLGFLATWLGMAIARRPRAAPLAVPDSEEAPVLDGIEAQLATDPVAAYRVMATSVRAALAKQYGFPARALTTHELQRRMETEGVDRWQSRLVRGLLDECDQVVYAGYRPAMERRTADLGMARELLEGPA